MGKPLIGVLAAAAVVAIGACANDLTQPGTAPQASAVIGTVNRIYEPQYTRLTAGGTVTWQFTGTHTVTFTGAKPDGGDIPPTPTGNDVTRTFMSPGTYGYACNYHAGMSGIIEVVSVQH